MAFKFAHLAAAVSLAALTLTGCGGKADGTEEQSVINKVTAPAGKSWSETVSITPDGGLLIGNPSAAIKVIEFASLTCGVCAQFSADSGEELSKQFLDSGRVSFEMRQYLRNPIDLLAASAIRCAPLDRQYALTKNIFASQADLFAGAEQGGEAAQAAMANQADPQRFTKAAEALGISAMFQSRGLSGEQVNACLGDAPGVEKAVANFNKWNETFEIAGTPTFIINGENVGTLNWPGMRDRLRALGAR